MHAHRSTVLGIILMALVFSGAAQAKGLPPHQGHPILPISAHEAARERALPKSFVLRIAHPVRP